MSQIIKAIKRIAITAEQKNYYNLPGELLGYFPPYRSVPNATPENLSVEQLEIVDRYSGNYQPRLSLEQIEEIIQPYQFRLPQELYDFYQMGNGCLPIGTPQDLDSIYNYKYFPSYTQTFITLQEAISCYKGVLLDYNPRLLTICHSYDEAEVVLVIVGSEKQQETSPVFHTYSDCINEQLTQRDIFFPSLTNMMLAYAELYEYKGKPTETQKENIVSKYGGNPRWFYW